MLSVIVAITGQTHLLLESLLQITRSVFMSQTKGTCGVDFNGDISFPKTDIMINVTLSFSHSSISFLKLVYVMY